MNEVNKPENTEDYLKSYWIASTKKTNYPSLDQDIDVDVAIVGGGIVGITAAYLLKKNGTKVAIIDAGRIVQGTSGFTTAKITSQHYLIYHKIADIFGMELAAQYAEANQSSIEFVEKLTKQLSINCDFERVPAYIYTRKQKYIKAIEKEADVALKLGIKADFVHELPINLNVDCALIFENQAQFHPRKYLLSIAEKIPGEGSYIFENTEAMDIEKGRPMTITTNRNKKVRAGKVIVASHFPFYDEGLYLARLSPKRSYIIAAAIKEEFPKGMYINAESPSRSLRSQPDGENQLVLVGGEGHKTAHGNNFDEHYDNLEKFAQSLFTVESVKYRWSAQDYSTLDNVPYVGQINSTDENIYVATGFGKWGMSNGTAAARLLADKILGKVNPWEEVYNPSRHFTGTAYMKLFTHNFDVAKELVIGKIKGGENGVNIKCGEAKVVELEGKKYGAYRDNEGVLHIIDTTCTHVGCELRWNDAEKSWDCPCHGSRFTYDGQILEGPATHKLNYYKEGANKIDPNIKL